MGARVGGINLRKTSRAEGSSVELRKDAASDQRLGCRALDQTCDF